MQSVIRVLIVEDSVDDVLLLIRQLQKGGYRPEYQRVDSAASLRAELQGQREWDIVLSDFNMPGFNGYEALAIVLQNRPHLPFIVVSGAIGEETAAALVKAGAVDYLLKGNIERLPLAVEGALREAEEIRRLNEAQTLLLHNEEKFRRLFESAGDAIYFFRTDGRLIDANPVAIRQWGGGGRDELFELNFRQLLAPEYAARYDERLQIIQQQGSFIFESIHLRKDGSQYPVEVNGCLLDYFNDKAVLALVRDITERKQAANLLKQALTAAEKSRDEINAILSSVTDGLLVTDLNGSVVLMNHPAETILRTDSQSVIGEPVTGCAIARILVDAIERSLSEKNGEIKVEWEIALPDAKHLQTIHARIAEVRSHDNLKMGTIALLTDVTRERELDRMKRDFITNAAHELSTPLTAILGFAELLLDKPSLPDETRQESLRYIVERTEHLGKIVDDLLNLGRLEYGLSYRVEKSPCSLNDIVATTVDGFRERIPEHNIEMFLAVDVGRLIGDKRRLSQVIDKLLSNAVKFSPKDKPVRIATEKLNGDCLVTVHDEGIGMTAEQVEKVYDPFFRVDNSNTAAGGLGLGMCVARNIVEAHGGTLWIDSKPGAGTTVTFRIPSQS